MKLSFAALVFALGCTGSVQVQPAQPPPPQPQPQPVAVAPAPAPAPPPPAPAPPQGHPAYLHALTDLRTARGYLRRPAGAMVKWDENRAIREIDAAINEIKHAAIDDGKPLSDHPMIDVHLGHRDRLRKAEEMLHQAAADIEQREDNAWAQGLRGRALGHIRQAEHAVHEAMQDRGH